MQAIAGVNRVFQDNEGGLVVDYIGIASALKAAMNDYTVRDRKNDGDTDIAKAAYAKFLEKLSICRDIFYGYDYSGFMAGSDLERSKAIHGAVNFIGAVDRPGNAKSLSERPLCSDRHCLSARLWQNRTCVLKRSFLKQCVCLVMRLLKPYH